MSAAVKATRFGSVARMATYTGLSPKTIRRRVEDGSIRGIKVGRRLLIPFEDIDRHLNGVTGPPSRSTGDPRHGGRPFDSLAPPLG